MTSFFKTYATPLITGLFLVSLISGVFLYFHVGSSYFHEMHEVLSMVLIIPFLLHIWKNWRAFLNYFRRTPMFVGLIVSVLWAGYYMLPADQSEASARAGGPPQFRIASTLMSAPATTVAPIFRMTPDEFVTKLNENGFAGADAGKPLMQIATDAGQNPQALMALLASLEAE